jgi:tetratricopeptide (TPR) repeat protein
MWPEVIPEKLRFCVKIWSGIDTGSGVLTLLVTLLLTGCSAFVPSAEQVERYATALSFYDQGRLQSAVAIAEALSGEEPRFHQATLLAAKGNYLQSRYTRAETQLAELLDRFPHYPDADIWLNRVLITTERYQEALARVETLLEFNPEDPRLLRQRAQIATAQDQPDQALAVLTRAAAFEEFAGLVRVDRGRIYAQFGQDQAATQELLRALALFGSDSPLAESARAVLRQMESN